MKRLFYISFALALSTISTVAIGQVETKPPQTPPAIQEETKTAVPPVEATAAAQEGKQDRKATQRAIPVKLDGDSAALTPENTKVEFVGTHVGDEPKPRLGGFKKFTGTLTVSQDGTSVESLTLDFETDSLWTELGGDLTKHLKNEDFLHVEKFPNSNFESTSVMAGEKEGTLNVIGNFTLLGTTNEISIPVTFINSDVGVLLKGNLKLDRTSFGMDKLTEGVSKEVSISLSVGEKTTGGEAQPQEQGQRRGGRDRDPAAMFKNQDKDGDGKLTGDEIPEFMQSRMEAIDADKDGSVSLEEIQSAMNRRNQRQGDEGDRQPNDGDRGDR